jgi:hypothetical protein
LSPITNFPPLVLRLGLDAERLGVLARLDHLGLGAPLGLEHLIHDLAEGAARP